MKNKYIWNEVVNVKIMSFTKQQHNMISEIDTNLQIERKINNQTNNLQTSINLYANKIKES
jgi:hypothetical protein